MNHWHTAASLQQSHRAELARDAEAAPSPSRRPGGGRRRRIGLRAAAGHGNRGGADWRLGDPC